MTLVMPLVEFLHGKPTSSNSSPGNAENGYLGKSFIPHSLSDSGLCYEVFSSAIP